LRHVLPNPGAQCRTGVALLHPRRERGILILSEKSAG
jgi:hypothetical protein